MNESKISGCFDNLTTHRREWYHDGELSAWLCSSLIVAHALELQIECVQFRSFNDLPKSLKNAPLVKAPQPACP